jgi:FixJ family two-component response regulator
MHSAPAQEANAAAPAATVIIVDDDAALLNALKFDLELEGFRVVAHANGRQVRPAELPKSNGCLVLDYLLPGQNGLELLRRLRAVGVALPAILITSHPGPALASRALALGGRIIEKPLLGDTLLAGIRSAISQAA